MVETSLYPKLDGFPAQGYPPCTLIVEVRIPLSEPESCSKVLKVPSVTALLTEVCEESRVFSVKMA